MSDIEKAVEFVAERRKKFLNKYDVKLDIAVERIGPMKTAWRAKWGTHPDIGMAQLEAVQHRLAGKAKEEGFKSMTDEELTDYLDVEELWWFLDSGNTQDFLDNYAPVMQIIMEELTNRGHQLLPSE